MRPTGATGMLADVNSAVSLIDAIAHLLGAVAWPAAVASVLIYTLRKHRAAVGGVFDRAKSIVLPGGAQIDLFEKVQEQQQHVLEAASKVAETSPKDRQLVVEELVKEANRYQELNERVDRMAAAIRREARGTETSRMADAALRRMIRQRDRQH